MALLEIQNLKVVYPNGTEALKSISLCAEAGEIVAIIGRSGAGKSTLLRCINGLQPTTAGTIRLDGEEITAQREAELRQLRRKIGFIWQEYNLVDRLPAITNVLTGRLGYNAPWRSALGLFDEQHREIARAMSQQPTIVLADEPVASLDPELAEQVMSVLDRVAREDRVLTLINIHQVELAKRFADRIIGIAQGGVVFDGPPQALDDYALNQIYRFDQPRPAGERSHMR